MTDPSTASVTGSLTIDGQIVSSRRIGKYLFFASRFYPSIPGEPPNNQTPEEWQATVNSADFYIRDDKVYAAPWDDLANPTPARQEAEPACLARITP